MDRLDALLDIALILSFVALLGVLALYVVPRIEDAKRRRAREQKCRAREQEYRVNAGKIQHMLTPSAERAIAISARHRVFPMSKLNSEAVRVLRNHAHSMLCKHAMTIGVLCSSEKTLHLARDTLKCHTSHRFFGACADRLGFRVFSQLRILEITYRVQNIVESWAVRPNYLRWRAEGCDAVIFPFSQEGAYESISLAEKMMRAKCGNIPVAVMSLHDAVSSSDLKDCRSLLERNNTVTDPRRISITTPRTRFHFALPRYFAKTPLGDHFPRIPSLQQLCARTIEFHQVPYGALPKMACETADLVYH